MAPLLAIDRIVAELAGTPARDDDRTAAQRRHDTALLIFQAGLARYGLGAEPTTDPTVFGHGARPDGAASPGGPLSPARVDPGSGVLVGPKRARRRVPEAHIVIGLDTWRGLARQPGELDGYGPVSPATARGLAGDGRPLRRVVVDAAGQVIDVSPRAWPPAHADAMLTAPLTADTLDAQPGSYAPSAGLGRYIDVRDRTCTAPWCTRPACSGQHDHITAFADGGATTRANLQAACDRDNQIVKARLGWTTIRARDGTTTWTSPVTGRSYTTEPFRYSPDG